MGSPGDLASSPRGPFPDHQQIWHIRLTVGFCASFLCLGLQPPGPCTECSCASGKEPDKDPSHTKKKENGDCLSVPKIFFGTRTHKQITQISRELKRTAYSCVPMTILSSRDYTCIHPVVSNSSNRNEMCVEFLEGKHVSNLFEKMNVH